MEYFKNLIHAVTYQHIWVEVLINLILLFILAFFINFIVKYILLRGSFRLTEKVKLFNNVHFRHTISRLANIAPTLTVLHGFKIIPSLPSILVKTVENVGHAFLVLTIALAISSFLSAFEDFYRKKSRLRSHSIKGLIQIVKIALFAVATILILATLVDRSPLILLSGLGAMAAVLLLVFQDTLLSLVASIQIASTDLIRVGDWITVTNVGADGYVVEIALYSVKVQNFDNTITTIPIRKLVTEPFTNWRGMTDSGVRRIKRALFIDQNSIKFLNDKDIEKLSKYSLLTPYLIDKKHEIEAFNKDLGDKDLIAYNGRRLTNIGLFRKYITNYLQASEVINNERTLMVRQLSPTAEGLPLEIYCFAKTVKLVEYESIIADIFDHLYSVVKDFNLQIFQSPNGCDWTHIVIEKNQQTL